MVFCVFRGLNVSCSHAGIGRARDKFCYAISFAHVVSIVKSLKDSDDLMLIDSNLRGTRLLRNVASEDRYRWFTFPQAYIVIREKA
eukprot:COSAG02_NODE_2127_length_9742_cov_32.510318_10_plen_86_part_00